MERFRWVQPETAVPPQFGKEPWKELLLLLLVLSLIISAAACAQPAEDRPCSRKSVIRLSGHVRQ